MVANAGEVHWLLEEVPVELSVLIEARIAGRFSLTYCSGRGFVSPEEA